MNAKNSIVASVIVFSVASAFVSAGHAAGTGASPSAASSCAAAPLSSMQRKILAKSAQSSAALRDYVYITRGIHRLDYVEASTWAGQYRAHAAACMAAAR